MSKLEVVNRRPGTAVVPATEQRRLRSERWGIVIVQIDKLYKP